MKLLVPTLEASKNTVGKGVRLSTFKGKTIGFLDNGKKGTAQIFDEMERMLKRDYGVAEVIRQKKPDFSRPAPPEVLSKLAGCDAVIAGVGD